MAFAWPVAHTFFWAGIQYNEGWNVYNAAAVAHHHVLYTHRYGFTTVNYPALSYFLVAGLHALGIPFLFGGRWLALMALLACCGLTGLIVRRLGATLAYACFAAMFALATFCLATRTYVGQDDPQILAEAFGLLALLVYISGPPGWRRLAAVAALLVVGGNLKNIILAFPVAVLVDLWLVNRRAALRFLLLALPLLGLSIAAEIHFGGPYFLADLLTPRPWAWTESVRKIALYAWAPLALALPAAAIGSCVRLRQRRGRVLAIFFWAALALDVVWAGGYGVAGNSHFTLYLAVAIICGAVLAHPACLARPWQGTALALLFLLPLAGLATQYPLIGAIGKLPGQQRRFLQQVAWLRARPGAAMCENMLLCYKAGKPLVWDPFNTRRFVTMGKLDPAPLLSQLERGRTVTIQLDEPVNRDPRLFPQLEAAIAAHYRLSGASVPGCLFYVPDVDLRVAAASETGR
ncbi:MAG: hypothetical protein ACRD04_11580 [Terriglobales bacterium]